MIKTLATPLVETGKSQPEISQFQWEMRLAKIRTVKVYPKGWDFLVPNEH